MSAPRIEPAVKTLPFLGRPSSLSDQVAGVLAERVLSGEWPAGHRLPSEPELVETFGVSRSVVRDAVRSLAARGLVEVRQGSGTVVRGEPEEPYAGALFDLLVRSDVTLADLAKAREAIDLMLCERAAVERDDDDVSRLRAAYAELCAAEEAADWARAEEAHLRFHVVLVESVHLPGLEILLRPLQRIIVDTSLPPDLAAPESWEVESHLPILEAIERRDPAAALAAMRRHYVLFDGPEYDRLLSRRVREIPRARVRIHSSTASR
jgi:GntR family transcriptional regulator, transcriptional repressor for pyruvate dehydrogenase complex